MTVPGCDIRKRRHPWALYSTPEEDPEILLSQKSPKQELDRLTVALERLGGHFWDLAARPTKFLLHDLMSFPFNLQVLHYLGPLVHSPTR
jgi:hypothetical protein